MAGRVLRVASRTTFDWSKLTATTGTQLVWLARRIDVSQWTELTLLLRFHSGTQGLSGLSTANVQVYADGYTDEDPGALAGTLPAFLTQIGSNTAFGTKAAGDMLVIAIAANAGGLISLGLNVTMGGNPTTNVAVVSADLSGKE